MPTDDTAQPKTELQPLAVRPVEAARLLGISPRKLWSITADKTSGIPVVRLGKSVTYPIDQLKAWLDAQCSKGGAK